MDSNDIVLDEDNNENNGDCNYEEKPLEIVRLLLDRGANVEAKTNDDLTPLYLACQKDSLECIWSLVSRCPWLLLGQSSGRTNDNEFLEVLYG
mmetsp:Transcript_31252/g.75209  ORF Transcript_31252/g.75209 Transcript_31252/m.75209 type:complete len:93 (+) Transcript_31252:476-754(+)|eukprot:CAMPEP_0113625308 /NCGR_PEP_ID=MMETSP0017_2-20120614/13072_1 /TAXON_ID=2856 /ORGANISM="Cylindrotheca closterium" /LENGTH=92 /DNA_ID=CAMNT_0000535417 /DNA_START=443 /DNA_END=721 /DNA_ORIENTATION=+ /assembly_acc=CAM_ASM_000147